MLMLDEILDRVDFCFDNDQVWLFAGKLTLPRLRSALCYGREIDTVYVPSYFEHQLQADCISMFHERIFFLDIHYIYFDEIIEYIIKECKGSTLSDREWVLFLSSKNKEINKETTLLANFKV